MLSTLFVGAAILCLLAYLIYLCVGRFTSGGTIYAEDVRKEHQVLQKKKKR